jgi:hypothetical protein
MPLTVDKQAGSIVVQSGSYQVVVSEGILIRFEAMEGWIPIARTVPSEQTSTRVPVLPGDISRVWYPEQECVAIEWVRREAAHCIVAKMRVSSFGPLIRIHARDAITGVAEISAFALKWEFLAGPVNGARPDFLWTPSLCPKAGQVVGEHMFRSPAAIVQHGEISFAITPDLSAISANQPLRSFLDLSCSENLPGPAVLSSGICAQKPDGHVYFTTDGVPPVALRDTNIEFGCEVFVEALAPKMRGHQAVSRNYWKTRGRNFLQDIKPQVLPFRDYYAYGYDFADANLWKETIADGKRVGAMTINREYADDVWFQGWFNQLRTAFGLFKWALRTDNTERQEKARATRELFFHAPQTRGLFPTIAILPEQGEDIAWVESTLQGGGPGLYHLLDNSWTAYWLLQWQLHCEPDARTLPFCCAYADELLRLQRPDGSLPDYVDVAAHECVTRYEPFEAAKRSNSGYVHSMIDSWGVDRLFLAELSRIVVDGERYFHAAQDAARFVERNVIPLHKWFDYETFFSCSPKPLDFFDSRTQQYPQNTLTIYWAAEAFRILYQITGTAAIGEQSVALTDYLCLYQQVWDPPFLSFYGFGGFGVMNTDGEWNDARQAVFADGLARQYLQSGRQEYLERAVAATRAAFACTYIPENAGICPKIFDRQPTGYADENYAHGGVDSPAGPSGFDWGIGSALTTAVQLVERFGDLWLDVLGGWALGIDALTVTECSQEGSLWRIAVTAPLKHTDTITVKGSAGDGEPIRLSLNGQPPILLSDEALRAGVSLPLG